MRKVRESIIPACNNYSLFPEGKKVFTCDPAGMLTINGLLDGQLVIYDYSTNIALGPGTTVQNYDRVVIGVGCDTSGSGGAATEIKKVFGDVLHGCAIQAATACLLYTSPSPRD